MTEQQKALCHEPDHTPRWGMTIDVNRCVGCQTCTIACKHWNGTMPGVQWRRVIDIEEGEFPNVERLFLVTGCQHCEEPPCVPVCPTGATKQREDGLVTMDYETCIGCGYCAVSCPYQARTIAHDMHYYYGDDRPTAQEEAVFDEDRLGVAQKCTFCIDRVDGGLEKGLTPGVDPEATPACSAACIAQAIKFGDFNDPNSLVSQQVAEQPYFQMHEELGTNPQIKYLYTTSAVPEYAHDTKDDPEDRQRDMSNPLVGQRQKFWDWRAAMNWCFGGLSTGAVIMLWFWGLFIDVPVQDIAWLNLGAGAIMGVGLFFVFLKIGRKLRFYKAIRRPHSSWMTRELYVVPLFGAAVLANLVFPSMALWTLTAAAAFAFLFCQAMILFMAKGIPAWRAPLVPWMIVVSGLLEGAGLVSLVVAYFYFFDTAVGPEILIQVAQPLMIAGLVLALVNAGLWTAYRVTAKARGIPPLSRDTLGRITVPLHVIGHAVPAAGWALLLAGVPGGFYFLLAASIGAMAGGFLWKFGVIVRGSFQQGFAMPAMPHRGSGERAAPPRLEGTDMRPIDIKTMAAE